MPAAGARLLWYFGGSYEELVRISSSLSAACTVVPVGDRLNALAERLWNELIGLDERLASGRFPLSWTASDIAEFNPYTSDLGLNLCRAVALVEAARSGGSHLVVVDDDGLGRALAKTCRRAGIAARWRGRGRRWLVPWAKALRAHLWFLRDWMRLRRALARHAASPAALSGRAPWLMSWIDGRGSPEPAERDRFLGGLPGWLRQDGCRIGWLGNPATWVTSNDDVAADAARGRGQEPCVLVPAFQRLADLPRAYLHLLAIPFAVRARLTIADVDVTPLVRRALARVMASPKLVRAALYADLAKAIERRGLRPELVLYTYENQPWEKAMLLGFRRALPATRLIGVQHTPFARNWISGHPGTRQWRDGTAPDLLLTIGAEFRERLLATGAPAERIRVGGALRFDRPAKAAAAPSPHRSDGSRRVLVTCPMEAGDAFELAHKAASATSALGVRTLINFHPMVDASFRTAVRERLTRLIDCRHVDFVDGNAAAWLGQADVLLYTSSSTVLEAAARDIPVIFVGSSIGLDLDVMPEPGTLRCRDAGELRRHIERVLDDPELRRMCIEAGRRNLERCMAEAEPETWLDTVRGPRALAAA
jgi:glycosyltransferase involved in cell wall biosynthesis